MGTRDETSGISAVFAALFTGRVRVLLFLVSFLPVLINESYVNSYTVITNTAKMNKGSKLLGQAHINSSD